MRAPETRLPSRFRRSGSLMAVVLALALGLSGCIAKVGSNVVPGAEIGKVKAFYVVRHDRDGRGVNQLIADEMTLRGLAVRTGDQASCPKDVEAVVTYQDRWMWDVTMYMLALDIQFRNPQTSELLASGQSYRSSLARKEPREMVKEILDELFKQK